MSFFQELSKIFGEETGVESPFENPMAPWCSIPRLHHLLPYESYDEKQGLFYNKTSTGFVLIADPLVGASLDDQGQMAQFFSQEKNLPEGTSVQFLLYASPEISPKLSDWKTVRKDGIFKTLAQKRVSFLEDKALHNAHHRVRDFRLLISYTKPGHVPSHAQQEALLEARRDLQATLRRMGMHATSLDADGFIHEMSALLTGHGETKTPHIPWNPHTSISKQIMGGSSDFEVKRDYVLKDATVAIKSYFPKVAPKYWSLAHMDHFLGNVLDGTQHIPTPFLLHYGFVVTQGQTSEKGKAIAKRSTLEKSLQGQLARWQPQIKEEYAEAAEVTEQLQRHQRIITSALSFTVIAEEERLSQVEQALEQIWITSEWTFESATYDHLGAFLAQLPMTWTADRRGPADRTADRRGIMSSGGFSSLSSLFKTNSYAGSGQALFDLGKAKKTITREAQNMLPILAEWKGQVSPGIPMIGRRGQIFFWNPFDGMLLPGQILPSNVSNYNLAIAGVPGSGKSFLCNEILTTILGVGGKAIVLDKGESFKNLCLLLGGHHIDFKATLDISINPFTNIPPLNSHSSDEMRDEYFEQMNALVAVLRTMCKPKEECSALEESYLKQAAQAVFEALGKEGCIDDVRQWLLKHEDKEAQNLGKMLWTFSKEGPYSALFNRPATVDLGHDLVVIETQNLKDDLKSVVVQLMMVQGWQRMVRSDRKTPFVFLVDEAWELIQGASSGKFVESFVRTARKYRASLILATQNLLDYFRAESPGAMVAFQNSEWKCILHQLPETTSAMDEHPFLKEFVSTSFRERLIRSLMPASGFSEVLIYGKAVQGVIGRLYVDPYSAILYSTNPQDFFDVQSQIKMGMTVGEAVERVLEERNGKRR